MAGWYVARPKIEDAQRCQIVKDRIAAQGAVVHGMDSSRKVGIIGDSFTSGDGLSDRRTSWAFSVGTDIDGVGMTGFTNGGYCGHQTFAERINDVLNTHPDTLIIQGGLNDVDKPAEVQAAATYTLGLASKVRRVIVVGPVDAPAREGEDAVDHALETATKAAGREYISAVRWSLPFLPDKTHMTPEGHRIFAQHVQDVLR